MHNNGFTKIKKGLFRDFYNLTCIIFFWNGRFSVFLAVSDKGSGAGGAARRQLWSLQASQV